MIYFGLRGVKGDSGKLVRAWAQSLAASVAQLGLTRFAASMLE